MVMVMPDKRTLELYKLDHLSVQLTHNFWTPLFFEQLKFFSKIYFFHFKNFDELSVLKNVPSLGKDGTLLARSFVNRKIVLLRSCRLLLHKERSRPFFAGPFLCRCNPSPLRQQCIYPPQGVQKPNRHALLPPCY